MVIRTILGLSLAISLWSPMTCFALVPVDTLLKEADTARSSNSTAFKGYLSQLNERVLEATPQQQQQLAYLNAYAQAFAGNFDESSRLARRLIETSADVDMQFRAGALIVNSYALNGRFTEGLRQLDKTLSLIGRVKDPELRQHGLVAAATIYNQIGQYELARHYSEMVLAERPSNRTVCFADHLRFSARLRLNALPSDDAEVMQSIENCLAQREVVMVNFLRSNVARKWAEQGQRKRAIALLRNHLVEVQSTGYPRLISDVRALLGELLFANGDLSEAEAHAQAVAAQSASISNTPPLVAAYKTLYDIAEHRRDMPAALDYFRRYADAEKAYLNEVKARELAYHIVRQETQQKNQQIELLKGQNEVLRLEQRVERQATQNSRLMVALLALLVASIGYWAYKIKRMHVSLRRFAETDVLTGLCNRHHFTLQAEKSIARCAKASEPVALVMFDLDHFKSINDNYGHVTGDWVLKQVADTCKAFCRPIDHIGRLGGEEFAILLHGCDLEAATRLAEDCRLSIARIETRDSGHSFRITASFGVSAASLSDYDLARLLSHADQMLYRAKRDGRNCVRGYVLDMAFAPLPDTSPLRGDAFVPGHAVRGLRP